MKLNNVIAKLLIVSSISIFSTNIALAQSLSATLTQKKVVIENGKEVFKDANKVMPSDIIEYSAVYKNTSNNVLNNVSLKLPVPSGMMLEPKSVSLTQNGKSTNVFLASIDNKTFTQYPVIVKVKNYGKIEAQNAHILSYKAISVNVEKINPNEEVVLKSRMSIVPAGDIGLKLELELKNQKDKIVE